MHNGYANAYKNLIMSLLEKNGYKIHVLTTTSLDKSVEISKHNLVVTRFNELSNLRFARFFLNAKSIAGKINRLHSKHSFDLVFIESGDEPLINLFLSKEVLDRLTVRYHSTSDTEYTQFFPGLNNRINKLIQNKILKHKLIYYSSTNDYHLDFIRKHFLSGDEYLISKKSFFKIPNTLGPGKLAELDNDIIESKSKQIFILGRLNPEGFYQKGFSDVLAALARMELTDLNGYKILIVGDGLYFEEIKSKFESSRISEAVTIERSLPHEEVLRALETSRAIILPSRFEGHSMFALEALASGCIGLFSNAGALPTMTSNKRFIFATQDTYELSKAIKDLVSLSDLEVNEYCRRSRRDYENNCAPEVVVDYFEHLLASISSSRTQK
ncbi:glycosyltransferase family 4 protein [Vibrio harveyi]